MAGAPLLHGFAEALPERDRAALLARGRQRRYRQNTRVFTEGDSSDFVLVIVDGTVKIVVTTEQGDESLLGVRGPGDVIGELAALDSEPRLASVVALEPVTAHVVTAEEFRSFIAERPKAAVELMRMLIGRLREADRRRVEFGSYDATTRVARLLVELADGLTADEHAALQVPLSQHEIGELVGTSRESVARALAVLRDRDLVSTGHRSIRILQLDALRSFHA
ncbi:MAG TPA: Crp/Fnr family transcriptional regulator [Acidimicrobiia bacterium]|nr:Crp/Fnr family transcriptional regulator [Acidimicrobiia bacterium]